MFKRIYKYNDLETESFFKLVELLKQNNVNLSLNNNFIKSYKGQPKDRLKCFNNNETLCNEVHQYYDKIELVYNSNLNKKLDLIIEKYVNYIIAHKNNLQLYLSGGQDSRVCLMLFLIANIDLGNVVIHSINLNDTDGHKIDYTIADLLSKKFNFELNNFKNNFLQLSNVDIFNKMKYYCETHSLISKYALLRNQPILF